MHKHDKIILGAGLAGLGLIAKLPDAVCYERENQPLGHARSYSFGEIHYDQGAHICHSKNAAWLGKLNIENAKSITNAKVRNFDNGVFFDYPVQNNLKQIEKHLADKAITEIRELSLAAIEKEPSNYLDWCNLSYGLTLTDKYYRRFTKKYWRSEMEDLGTYWMGGRLIPVDLPNIEAGYLGNSADQSVFKSYYYPKGGGFENLFEKLLDGKNTDQIIFCHDVVSVSTNEKIIYFANGLRVKYETLYSTIPLIAFVDSDKDAPQLIKEKRKNLYHTSLFVLVVKYTKGTINDAPDWFYIYDEDIDISRVFNISSVSNYSGPDTYMQCETFRRNDEEYIESDVLAAMLEGASKVFQAQPVEYTFRKIEFAYVVPTRDTPEITKEILDYYRQHNIHFRGLYGKWNYVWSDAAYFDGLK